MAGVEAAGKGAGSRLGLVEDSARMAGDGRSISATGLEAELCLRVGEGLQLVGANGERGAAAAGAGAGAERAGPGAGAWLEVGL